MKTEELKELIGKVTPGEWRLEHETTLIWGACNHEDNTSRGMGYPVAETRITPAGLWARGPDLNDGIANATLISLAPSLARRVIAAEKLVEAGVRMRDYFTKCGNDDVYATADFNSALTEYEATR